ncbi:hypothetical protein EVAR_20171_1 [Eumeta japonica]|uniref:Uncharacterized protein n=1 Tax=Eumeta variegata TaxID=151549 RepID=A0A4C1UV26_EUMVA|nr:hypothetical protein EVAR_20171_1 [Eumeta japonica]
MRKTAPSKPLPSIRGLVLAIYPENTETAKTADETKKIVKSAVNPVQLNVQIDRAGVKITDSRKRRPLLFSLSNLSMPTLAWTDLTDFEIFDAVSRTSRAHAQPRRNLSEQREKLARKKPVRRGCP